MGAWDRPSKISHDFGGTLPRRRGTVCSLHQETLGCRCSRGIDQVDVLALGVRRRRHLRASICGGELRGDVDRDDLRCAARERLVVGGGEGGGRRCRSLWERCPWRGEALPELVHGDLFAHLEALLIKGDDHWNDGDTEFSSELWWNVRRAVGDDCNLRSHGYTSIRPEGLPWSSQSIGATRSCGGLFGWV